ncbi:hypothetical protein [Nocardia brasiliensis]|uniref:hypothetical protein n=1 Tax=Nocardia brasiliensis TaxID=37326 RepID=UPI002458CC0C|nr:hypothetical protein [Nocardia brasiliensis]
MQQRIHNDSAIRSTTGATVDRSRTGMGRYLVYCTERLNDLLLTETGYFPRSVELADTELREIITACNAAIAPFGRRVSDRRWISYLDVVHGQSERRVVDREAFKAVCILNNILFIWDDLDPRLKDLELLLPKIRAICERYYCNMDDVWWAYQGVRSWLVHDRSFSDSRELTSVMCRDLENYTRLRVTDLGPDWWMKASYPIYRDPDFTEHCRSGLAAWLTVRPLFIVNDLYSYDREHELGELKNCYNLCDVTDEHAFLEYFDARLYDLQHDIATIKAFDQITRDVLLDLIYGHFTWATKSDRYQGAVNTFNAPVS